MVPFPARRLIGRLATAILVVVALVAGVWFKRVPLLREAASAWIVSDPVTASDVAVVFGGDVEIGPRVAAQLYKKGLVTKVLVSQVPESRVALLGVIPTDTELTRMMLLKLGVPETAIETFGHANESTKDAAVNLRNWAEEHRVSRIVIPTETFAARRVRWILHREFAGSSVQLEVPSYDGPEYTRRAWWRTKAGLISFENGIISYLYDRLKY
jgi:uncharacterized SAM-binding protein YcdF (DUF218 family)